MPTDVEIVWDQHALEVYLVKAELEILPVLAEEVAAVATFIAPVRGRRSPVPKWARKGYVGTPGRLKASVQWNVDEDYIGPYADIAALWYGRFLDPPAKQIKSVIPFLPTSLYWVVEGKNFYLTG